MTRRKVLVSAYACEPGLGSEAGIGWSWVREIAARHDTWLVTRENNVARIVEAAREQGIDGLHVVGHDLPRWTRFWKRGGRGAVLYFYLWQLSLASRARRLDREIGFDVVHHLTFASSWIPSGLVLLKKPFVWGPVGRHPRVPDRFLLASDWRGRLAELSRASIKALLSRVDPFVTLTRERADVILGIGADDVDALPRPLRAKARPFLACGTEPESLPASRFERGTPFEVLFAGRLVDLKGVRLAIEAFARLAAIDPHARFVVLGTGPRRGDLERRASELGVRDRVDLVGHLPRHDVLARMRRADVFLFPSFEGAGMVVVEALAAGAPVVCLDHGGPGDMVRADRGVKVPVGDTFETTACALGDALVELHADEPRRRRLALGAYRWAHSHATWSVKGEHLESFYSLAEQRHARGAA
jgi:glycosyltransferase involved in cell wall biosynthesis